MAISHVLFLLSLGYYLMTNMQWYNYKIERVFFKHHKWKWHIFYFFMPLIMFFAIGDYFYIYLYVAHLFGVTLWAKKLDKKLVFTGRVKRFFAIYIGFIVFGEILCFVNGGECDKVLYLLPLLFALLCSDILERVLLNRYATAAKDRLRSMANLTIIAITGSYGKTSLKNFLAQILSSHFKVHSSPRSVNTFAGIVADINQNLSPLCEIYIAEAGARAEGDIREIAQLLEHHYGIIGKIGEAHIEYFKSIENITKTKFELVESPRLRELYSYTGNEVPQGISVIPFPSSVKNINATLAGTSFELEIDGVFYPFETEVLGAFNVINISAAILMAHKLGIQIDKLQDQVKNLKPIEHRLQKMDVNTKLILDDSFNGNLDGMLEAVRLASLYKNGRKIIVTPGLVESSEEANIKLAHAIDEVFDIAILTGELNSKTLSKHISKPQKIIIKEKSTLQEVLKAATLELDLILFANDAPNYI
ncbi:MAG: Mur ligase family protein [Wolinella sp.]